MKKPLSGYLSCAEALSINLELNGESFNFGPKSDYTKSEKDLIDDKTSMSCSPTE